MSNIALNSKPNAVEPKQKRKLFDEVVGFVLPFLGPTDLVSMAQTRVSLFVEIRNREDLWADGTGRTGDWWPWHADAGFLEELAVPRLHSKSRFFHTLRWELRVLRSALRMGTANQKARRESMAADSGSGGGSSSGNAGGQHPPPVEEVVVPAAKDDEVEVLAAMWADKAAVDSGTPLMLLETLAALRLCPEGTNTFRREKKKMTRDRFSSQFDRWCSFLPELWDENVWAETELTRRGDTQRPRDGTFFFFIAAIEVPSLVTPFQLKSSFPRPDPHSYPRPCSIPDALPSAAFVNQRALLAAAYRQQPGEGRAGTMFATERGVLGGTCHHSACGSPAARRIFGCIRLRTCSL
jgi:hypothetical protein